MKSYQGNGAAWDALISELPSPHWLQTWEWSRVKAKYGWEPMPFVWQDQNQVVAAAMILKRRIPLAGMAARLSILYIPKGPLMVWSDEDLRARVLDDLQRFAHAQGAIFLKIDPDVMLGTGIPGSEDAREDNGGQVVMSALKRRAWRFSVDQIQFRNTVLVDLSVSEEEMLARMKQKTRYNTRLADRKGVVVRVGNEDDWPMLYNMYAETSVRDGFAIREEGYYLTVWQTFQRSGFPACEPLIAEVEGEPVAAIFVFYFAGRAYYVYGMSRAMHRNKMPTYLLQWEAMKRAKVRECAVYDLWGAPEVFNETDSMWGVFRFKQGLGGRVIRTLGAWDYTPKPFWYRMYAEIIPRVLDVMRSRGKEKTRRNLD